MVAAESARARQRGRPYPVLSSISAFTLGPLEGESRMRPYGRLASAVALCAALIVGGAACHRQHQNHNDQDARAGNSSAAAEPHSSEKRTMNANVAGKTPHIDKSDFGQAKDGQQVDLYTLRNTNGMVAKIMTYGAIVTELHVPDRQGKDADVVLGFGSLD